MSICDEYNAEMQARGWKPLDYGKGQCGWSAEADSDAVFHARVCYYKGWEAMYGVNAVSCYRKAHTTPIEAAEEVEAWFRHIVSGLPGLSLATAQAAG